MANIFVGFHDRKNCSRILKPPGGGTSDIFNTSASEKPNESVTPQECSPKSSPTKEKLCPLNGIDTKIVAEPVETGINNQNGDSVPDDNTETPKIETLSVNENDNKEEVQEKVEEKKEDNEMNNSKTESMSSLIHENQHKENLITPPEKKSGQRVPPGGYSSGLW